MKTTASKSSIKVGDRVAYVVNGVVGVGGTAGALSKGGDWRTVETDDGRKSDQYLERYLVKVA